MRFEWTVGPPRAAVNPAPAGVRRAEAVAANNVVYVMGHWAPNGESPEGKAAFDAIAEELNRAGHQTRTGTPWRFEYVRSALRTVDRHTSV